MKINVRVCEICKQEYCDGIIYRTKKKVSLIRESDAPPKIYRTCKSRDNITIIDGEINIKWVVGHGDCSYLPAEIEK